ncbi:ATP-dependent DNA helicase [soil metagenome]
MDSIVAADLQHYSIAVRELCEFAAKAGDLDHRFTPSPSAQEGIAGHQVVASRRGPSRRSELAVGGSHEQLRVRGRIDGYDESAGVIEEVKTYRGDLARMPANHRALHWAQAKVYGALLCRQTGLHHLKVSLVYFEITRQDETVLVESFDADELDRFFRELCDSFLHWATRELAHRRARDHALSLLQFPFDGFRAGQRRLAENVFRAARRGEDLLAQAPTGIGKTTATLFPMLKACATEGLDKVFYLTAKNSGQPMVSEAIARLRALNPGLPLRVLELVSRESSCEHPGQACHGDACPLASGFYDRLPAARADAIDDGGLDRESVRRVARAHAVCPYYLSQELARWCDVAIGDYNYFFDSTALLHLLTVSNQWKVGVLVDEAHNLLERARGMYTAELRQEAFDVARRLAPATLRGAMSRLAKAWTAVPRVQVADYEVHAHVPKSFESALQELTTSITAQLSEVPAPLDGPLMRLYFDALHFQRRLQTFAAHSMFDVTMSPQGADLCIRNVVPAFFLRQRYAAARTTVLFSATLAPPRFYADMLGVADTAAWLAVDTPFTADQLEVRIVSDISTRWQHREASLVPIAETIARQYVCMPGNYMAFFSSFDYLERAAQAFQLLYPSVPIWLQSRSMDAVTRTAFLARFAPGGSGIGFAVLGGAFAEGIDLPGDRLIGAFIATLGLPQINAVNEAVRERLESMFGSGYEYTYLFPGLRKVVQAAGRVIRSTSDRGSVHLIDSRFDHAGIRTLLPAWWQPSLQPQNGAGNVRRRSTPTRA